MYPLKKALQKVFSFCTIQEILLLHRLEELRKATEEGDKTNLKNLYTQYVRK